MRSMQKLLNPATAGPEPVLSLVPSTTSGPVPEADPQPKSHPFLKLDLRELEGFVRLGLTDAEVRVYLVLRSYDHVNTRGETKGLVWPSVPTLAERVGKSVRNTRIALRGLEEKKVIERKTTNRHGGSNLWKINYPLILGQGHLLVIDGTDPEEEGTDLPETLEELSTGRTNSSGDPGRIRPGSPDDSIRRKDPIKESGKDSLPPTPGVASAHASDRARSGPGSADDSLAPRGVQGADAPEKEEEEEEVCAAWRNAGHPEPLSRPVQKVLAELTAVHGTAQVCSAITASACSSKTTPGRAYLPHVQKLLSQQSPPLAETAWQFCTCCGQGYQDDADHEERCPGQRERQARS